MTRTQVSKSIPWALGTLAAIAMSLAGWGLSQAYSHESEIARNSTQIDANTKQLDSLHEDVREIRAGVQTLLERTAKQ